MLRLLNTFFVLILSSFVIRSDEWCQDYESRRCNLWKSKGLCKSTFPRVKNMMKKLCYETCNFCEPPAPEKCYDYRKGEVSVHGCCWDGIIAATGPGGQGCPACENSRSRQFCSMMKHMCFTRTNYKLLRISCPETCGYCIKAQHPCQGDSGQEISCQNDCYDVDPKELCKHRKRTGYCSLKAWEDYLMKRCARTCGFCGADHCRDMISTRVCFSWKARNRCTNATHPAWRKVMIENCRLTCGLCSDKRFINSFTKRSLH
ncbi:uncharacterized protein [Porites lutea]|uniref:uncharacterized protein isoform X1 n=1 Tax=Porites lutea TaxID=51062 RepID=UPI003CC50C04